MSKNESGYILEAIENGHISGNGLFTKKCHKYFCERYRLKKVLMTSSCTDALEMSAILLELKPGDEVIIPSYTFVSSANAFLLHGAKIVFADIDRKTLNISPLSIESCLSSRTRAIVVIHYAGVACDMDRIMEIARRNNLLVIEDAAHAIESKYKGRQLGSLGDFGTFSFHETKNIISGEGGLLAINNEKYLERCEIIWEKGTNRSAFFRGEVNKYEWIDIGSSFLPSDIIAAFLYGQLENIDEIQRKRLHIWHTYYEFLKPLAELGKIDLPFIPEYASNNAHIFYILVADEEIRNRLLRFLRSVSIGAVFHYLPLHKSKYFRDKYLGDDLPNSVSISERIIRLPLFYELADDQIEFIANNIIKFYDAEKVCQNGKEPTQAINLHTKKNSHHFQKMSSI